jgi:spore maturation protein CgeB
MGDVANHVMYRDVDHLNRLVDEYLTHPHRRQDVSRYLRHRVSSQFSFGALARRLLVDEAAWKG